MPLYEYRCKECGEEQEHHHKMAEEPPPCPKCKGLLERVISAPKVARAGQSRLGQPFYSEAEAAATAGPAWRETAKNPHRPGGDRKAIYFH